MIRQIIHIDTEKCDGCGLCVNACHEGAIGLRDGKAVLLRDDYCDGLGNCLPVCPTGAITFEEREALPYDDEAVQQNIANRDKAPQGCPGANAHAIERPAEPHTHDTLACGCPGTSVQAIERQPAPHQHGASACGCPGSNAKALKRDAAAIESVSTPAVEAQLSQWPVQIKLVPPNAAYLQNAHLLISADCAAYAYGNFHADFIRNHITLIGCPKLDEGDYTEKLTAMLRGNDIQSVTVVRMEVPCCGGLEHATATALQNAGKPIPGKTVIISTDGRIVNERAL